MADHVVTRSVLIPAAREEIWDALVDPSRLEDWFADEVEGEEVVPEAEVVFRWEDGSERVGVVEEVDAPRRLTFRWAAPGGEETEVAFELDEEAAGTRVTVVERGLTGLTGLTERSAEVQAFASAGEGDAACLAAGGPGAARRRWDVASDGGAWAPRMAALGMAARAVLA